MKEDLDRRAFLKIAGNSLGAAVTTLSPLSLFGGMDRGSDDVSESPIFRLEFRPHSAGIDALSWDTEGGEKTRTNLLREGHPVALRLRIGGTWQFSTDFPSRKVATSEEEVTYVIPIANGAEVHWKTKRLSQRIEMTISAHGRDLRTIEAVELHFPFDPRVTPTTIIPKTWSEDGHGLLPAVVSCPDFGQVVLDDASNTAVQGRLEGSRADQKVDLILELPSIATGQCCTLTFTPLLLPAPKGMVDEDLWRQVRRGWFNTWQPSSQWGDQTRPFSAPVGILANNVISDPVSFALPFYADQALWTPEIAPGISIMDQVRRSIEWWLEERTDSAGEVIGYWNYRHFLDANPGILISAWDYVEATGDLAWLRKYLRSLEMLSTFLESRDIDQDGMVEATQSGNAGTLIQPARSCCWWDALNCGHKDGYSNALIYRAWRCLAELEGQVGHEKEQARYTELADRLKAIYAKTLINPETGWLAWWKSADGQLHDYATPIVNGLAIDYGLVEPEEGRQILARLRKKMQDANFRRMDLGLPCTLVPVRRTDYLLPDGLGVPYREDGTDTFQNYMNGGISAGHTLHFIMAHHRVGEPETGDAILRAMLGRQAEVGFENGVRNQANKGIDWTTWNGEPRGYEGYLADVFMFLQASVLREASFQERFYRPLLRKP